MFDYFNNFYRWIYENPDKVDTTTIAVYFALLNTANRLNWKEKFSIVLCDIQEMCGVSSRTTILKALNKLEENCFVKTVTYSKNQYKNRVICLPLNEKHVKSTRKANEKHVDSSLTHHKTYKTIKDYKDLLDNKGYFQNEKLKQTFLDFIQTRIDSKKKPTEKAVDLLVKKLGELSNKNPELAIRIIENSIESSWQSFFAIKKELPKDNHSYSRASRNKIL